MGLSPAPSPGHGAQPLCVLQAQWVGRGCPVPASGLAGSLYPCGCLMGVGGSPKRKVEREEVVLCSSPALQAQSEDSPFRFWELLLTTRPGIGWVYGSASPTGVALLLLLVLMFACSSSCIRRSGHFEVSSPSPWLSPAGSPLRSMPCPLAFTPEPRQCPGWSAYYVHVLWGLSLGCSICLPSGRLLTLEDSAFLPTCPNWIRPGSGRGRSTSLLSFLIYKVDLEFSTYEVILGIK